MFIDRAEDGGGHDGEFVRTIRVIEVVDDVLEHLVIQHEMGRELVRFLSLAFFLGEMKQHRVVALVGGAEEFQQARVSLVAVGDAAEFSIILGAAILTDAQENETVDGFLDGEVEIADGERGISQCKVAGKQITPTFDFGQEVGIHFGAAFFLFVGFRVFVERTLENGTLGKDACDFVPLFRVLIVGAVERASLGG